MFENYENILYPFKIGSLTVEKLVKDITTNLKIQENVVELAGFFSDYIIGDGETPEIIAWKVYGDAKLHYLVMLANSLYDWRKDFPLTQNELDAFVNETYANPNGIHHWVNSNTGEVVIAHGEFDVPVTNYEYEYNENEKKRYIRLIRPEYATDVVDALNRLLKD